MKLGLKPLVEPPIAAQPTGEPDYGGWFENTSNFDGTVDKTGQQTVTVTVGAKGNNGNYAFSPAAIRVDPGTEIVWEWTGKGSLHEIVAEAGAFNSEMTDEAGHTFTYSVEETGVIRYACRLHKAMGMKGALVVSGAQANTGSNSGTRIGDPLVLGGGLGLVGTLLTMFAFGVKNRTRKRQTDS